MPTHRARAFWTNIPLTIIPLIIFNLFGSIWSGDPDKDPWVWPILHLRLPSTATWSLTSGDALISLGVLLLFFEMLKATRATDGELLDHIFATLVFAAYLVEFLVVRFAAHSVFFVLMLITLVGLIGGVSVTIRSARRNVNYETD